MPLNVKVQPMILAVATVVITISGALYGAGLKEKQQINQQVKERRQVSPTEKIKFLEQTRTALAAKKVGLEKKIAMLQARQAGEEAPQDQKRKLWER